MILTDFYAIRTPIAWQILGARFQGQVSAIGGVWNGHFPGSEKYFSEAEISRKMPEIPQKERFSAISASEI